jgi:DNA sulfur modification protein DndD
VKLFHIVLNNFRQYKGEVRWEFASSEDKPITFLFGANGSGKTTMLNACRWALYGTLSEDVEQRDALIHNTVWDEADDGAIVGCFVELAFEHGGFNYIARRTVETSKSGSQRSLPQKLSVTETDESGNSTLLAAPEAKIDSIMPAKLADFFFFNGERIERLVQPEAYKEVEDSIKRMLGIEYMEAGAKNLKDVVARLTRDFSKLAGNDAERLTAQLESEREAEESLIEEIGRAKKNISSFDAELDRIQAALVSNEVTRELSVQRKDLEASIQRLKEERGELQARKLRRIAESGFVFTRDLCERFRDLAESMMAAGQLPHGVQQSFLEGLLQQGECICGTDLRKHADARSRVEGKKDSAGVPEVQGTWMDLRGHLALLSDKRAQLRDDLDDLTTRIANTYARLREQQELLTEVNRKLGETDDDQGQDLETRRQELLREAARTNGNLGIHQRDLEAVRSRIETITTQIDHAVVQGQQASLAQQRLQCASKVRDALNQILEVRTESARRTLDEKIRNIFRKITIKDYRPVLSEDFHLDLYQNDKAQIRVARSTGENQILSLSFIAAVLDYASEKERDSLTDPLGVATGGRFPIVMDAAFGSLDENYQREVARALRTIAPQIVVMASKSQGLGTVYDELEPSIGSLGVIVAHTTNSDDKREVISLKGSDYAYIVTNSEDNRADIMEVR